MWLKKNSVDSIIKEHSREGCHNAWQHDFPKKGVHYRPMEIIHEQHWTKIATNVSYNHLEIPTLNFFLVPIIISGVI